MLLSMTGYGRGEASNAEVTVVVEIKSVNNRFRDVQLRCPREYMALEPRIHTVLKNPFNRGRIEVYVRRQATGSRARVTADLALAAEYARVIHEVAELMVGHVSREVPFAFVVGQPGVLSITESEVDALTEWNVVEVALESAIQDLLAMRRAEGEALRVDLTGHLGELRAQIADIEAAAEGIHDRLRARLDARVKRMLGERIDPVRMAQEIALLVDKADISEETARMRSHCDQFDEALVASEPVGRRLDFLLQEMNREANTIGSKAAESPVTRRAVDMKATLERMREQSANVE